MLLFYFKLKCHNLHFCLLVLVSNSKTVETSFRIFRQTRIIRAPNTMNRDEGPTFLAIFFILFWCHRLLLVGRHQLAVGSSFLMKYTAQCVRNFKRKSNFWFWRMNYLLFRIINVGAKFSSHDSDVIFKSRNWVQTASKI